MLTCKQNTANHSRNDEQKDWQKFEISRKEGTALRMRQTACGKRTLNHHLQHIAATPRSNLGQC